jgi:hypothetical protein
MAEKKPEKKKGKKGKTKEIHARRADSGGYIAKHDMLPEEMEGKMLQPPQQEHVLPDIEALKQHMQDHLGPEEEEQEGQQAGK